MLISSFRAGLFTACAIGLIAVTSAAQQPAAADVEISEEPVAVTDVTAPNQRSIFDNLDINLLDLEILGEEIRDRMTGPPIRLTLRDCVLRALDANPDILVSGYDPGIAANELLASRGEFDPLLSAQLSHADSSRPPSPLQVVFGGFSGNVVTRNSDFILGLSGRANWGTQYSVDYQTNREVGSFTGGQSVYSSSVGFTLTQPLLRGLGRNANLATVRTRERGVDIADAQVELTVLNSIGETVKAYWTLVGAIELLSVRTESYENAQRLLRINEQRLDIGTAAAIEVLQAKAQVASRQGELITARTAILNSEDNLKNLIGLQNGMTFEDSSIVPVDRPGTRDIEWDMEDTMRKAAENRPEVRTAMLQLENSETEKARARNDLLPQLDAVGGYTPNSTDFTLGDNFTGIRDKRGRSWSIGIVGSIPIGNRAAKGNFRRADLSTRQAEQNVIRTEQQVMLTARTALRDVLSSQILVEANQQARVLEEANAAAEERRLLLGVTTTQNVLDRQEDLTFAQLAELQSIIDFERALVDLQVAEGNLLEEYGINYEALTYEDAPYSD